MWVRTKYRDPEDFIKIVNFLKFITASFATIGTLLVDQLFWALICFVFAIRNLTISISLKAPNKTAIDYVISRKTFFVFSGKLTLKKAFIGVSDQYSRYTCVPTETFALFRDLANLLKMDFPSLEVDDARVISRTNSKGDYWFGLEITVPENITPPRSYIQDNEFL